MDPRDSKNTTDVLPVIPLPSNREADRRPYVLVMAGPGAGRLIPVEASLTLGRRGAADVALDDPTLSRVHCRIELDEHGDAYLLDLSSHTGTFVNQARATGPVLLRNGDQLRLGDATILKFTLQDDLEAQFQRNLYDAALRDHLTRVFNKRYLMERCEQEFAYARRHGTELTFLLLDLDHFKRINDEHGHLAGDHVLHLLGQQLLAVIRAEDVVGRFGGEEFAVLAHGLPVGRALLLAERIRHLVEQTPYRWQRRAVPLTASFGLAGLPDPTIRTPAELMTRADEAMYRAKRDGRNLTRVYAEGHAA